MMIDLQKYYMEKMAVGSAPDTKPVVPPVEDKTKETVPPPAPAPTPKPVPQGTPFDKQVEDRTKKLEAQKKITARRGEEQSWGDEALDTGGAILKTINPIGWAWGSWKGAQNQMKKGFTLDPYENWKNFSEGYGQAFKTKSGVRQDEAQTKEEELQEKVDEAISKQKDYEDAVLTGQNPEQVKKDMGVDDEGNITWEHRIGKIGDWISEHPLMAVGAGLILYKTFFGGDGGYQMGPMGGYGMGPQQGGNIITRNPLLSTAALGTGLGWAANEGMFGNEWKDWFTNWMSSTKDKETPDKSKTGDTSKSTEEKLNAALERSNELTKTV
jgi:hypothetical protein